MIGAAQAQPVHLQADVYARLKEYCDICGKHPADTGRVLMPGQYSRSRSANFHNSHVLLMEHDPDAAYQYILRAMADMDEGERHPLYPAALFLKAKVQYSKRLYVQSLQNYLYLVRSHRLDTALLANCFTNVAEICVEQYRFSAALHYLDAWERRFRRHAGTYTIKSVYHNKALCYFHLERYPEAEHYFLESIALEEQLQDTTGLAISHMDMANLFYVQYLDDKAIPLFEKGLYFAQRSGDLEVLGNAHQNMAVVEENRQRYQAALEHRKSYEQLRDSIWDRDRVWELARQERKLALQKREHTIHVLGWQRNTLLLAASAFLLFAAVVWLAYRQLRQRNRIIAEQASALKVLNQTKDRLFSIVAHDLRSPVFRLKGNLARLRKAILKNELTDALSLAASNEKIAGSTYILMDNLLHWAMSQTGQLFFRAEQLHLHTVLNQVCYDLRPLAADKKIFIEQQAPPDLFFTADLHSFKIIVRNLMDNAIKYTLPGGQISITASLQQTDCCIRIADTGIGMDDGTLQALFDPDHKRMQKDTDGRQSTGLGLWLCKNLAERNKGRLEVASAPGKGTTITICLPVNTPLYV